VISGLQADHYGEQGRQRLLAISRTERSLLDACVKHFVPLHLDKSTVLLYRDASNGPRVDMDDLMSLSVVGLEMDVLHDPCPVNCNEAVCGVIIDCMQAFATHHNNDDDDNDNDNDDDDDMCLLDTQDESINLLVSHLRAVTCSNA